MPEIIEFDTVDKHAHESCARFDSAAGPTQTKKRQRILAKEKEKEKEKSVAKAAGRSQPSVSHYIGNRPAQPVGKVINTLVHVRLTAEWKEERRGCCDSSERVRDSCRSLTFLVVAGT